MIRVIGSGRRRMRGDGRATKRRAVGLRELCSLCFFHTIKELKIRKRCAFGSSKFSCPSFQVFPCVGLQFIFSGETESSPASFIAALGLAGTSRQQMRPCCHIPQLLQFQIVLQEFFLGTEQSPILDHIDNVLDKNFHILPKTALKT